MFLFAILISCILLYFVAKQIWEVYIDRYKTSFIKKVCALYFFSKSSFFRFGTIYNMNLSRFIKHIL